MRVRDKNRQKRTGMGEGRTSGNVKRSSVPKGEMAKTVRPVGDKLCVKSIHSNGITHRKGDAKEGREKWVERGVKKTKGLNEGWRTSREVGSRRERGGASGEGEI